jgi:hypothetical protein
MEANSRVPIGASKFERVNSAALVSLSAAATVKKFADNTKQVVKKQ